MAGVLVRARNSTKLNVLLYEGYRYQKNRVTNSYVYWRCWVKNCRASAKTSLYDYGKLITVFSLFRF